MAVEGKPLRVYTHLPSSSQSSAATLLTASSGSPTSPTSHRRWTTKAGQFALTKRKWIAVAVVYAVLVLAWVRGWQPHAWRRRTISAPNHPAVRLRAGERAVYDAYGQPHIYPPRKDAEAAGGATALDSESTEGTTSLGPGADHVYHLSDPSPALYLHTLEQFLFKHFPATDTDATDPDSLLSVLRSFFPSPSDPPYKATIPHQIFLTAANQQDLAQKEPKTQMWADKNSGWAIQKQDDEQADAWVRKRFALSSNAQILDDEQSSSAASSSAGIVAAWDRLSEPAVLRSDFWRYLVLAVDGGVYTDTDVECLKPIAQWGEDPDWRGSRCVVSRLHPLMRPLDCMIG